VDPQHGKRVGSMKKGKKVVADVGERMAALAESTTRGLADMQTRLEGGFKALGRDLTEHVKGVIDRYEAGPPAVAEALAAIQEDVRHWRHDYADLEARIQRIEKKLGLTGRVKAAR
jgi:ubiquinone biosynthesis protein UbiJ